MGQSGPVPSTGHLTKFTHSCYLLFPAGAFNPLYRQQGLNSYKLFTSSTALIRRLDFYPGFRGSSHWVAIQVQTYLDPRLLAFLNSAPLLLLRLLASLGPGKTQNLTLRARAGQLETYVAYYTTEL